MNNSDPSPAFLLRKSNRATGETIPGANASGRASRGFRPRRRLPRLGRLGLGGLAIFLGGMMLPGCARKSPDNGAGSAAVTIVAPAVVQVSIRNLQFSPAAIEVRTGDVIEWKNEDIVPHTATSATFDSGSILSGQSWRHTFTDAGRISYVCTFHPQMKGTVTVK